MKLKIIIPLILTMPFFLPLSSLAAGLIKARPINTPPARATVKAKIGEWAGSWQDSNAGEKRKEPQHFKN